ncbi:OsmC family protein [Massilia sp. MS-15]|uniref:OsmC family protein n=1 Tax=Massilia sp. MS-15 TaxID=2878200 RepID=UPI001CD4FF23|nr:OsmC family protein [Massilia sp. MS-15]MCA1247509.1 OsmC family protein [Massilia sp. MS-15]
MKQFGAEVRWERAGQAFLDGRYSRAHDWRFDGGLQLRASSSPLSVPVPLSDPQALDPEEALAAAASSCHMLFFLALAAQAGYIVDSYQDGAVAYLGQDADGRDAITRIELQPAIVFGGPAPTPAALAGLHHAAHTRCYVANSLKADILVLETH